jgi:hypothetical protein
MAREMGFLITDDIDGEAGVAERIDVPTKVRITGKAVVADDRDTRLSGTFPHHDLIRGRLGPRGKTASVISITDTSSQALPAHFL